MRRIVRSFGFAWQGLMHALLCGRNLRLFLLGECAVLLFALRYDLTPWEWIVLLFSAGFFISVELLNTALECLTDTVDQLPKEERNASLHRSMKATKDVSAAAALIAFGTAILIILLVLGPYVVREVSTYGVGIVP